MKKIVILGLLALLTACGDDGRNEWRPAEYDSGTAHTNAQAGVCKLGDCPTPDEGVACCTPFAECGFDKLGTGQNCVANPGAIQRVCKLSECELPSVGNACCTPNGLCGYDPFANGLQCFALPPTTNTSSEPTCDVTKCEVVDGGPPPCCLPNGECGVDSLGIGFCFVPPPSPQDAGTPPPDVSTMPPDDPSYDGQCPSFLGAFGPVWGCCSQYGVCGTFAYGSCLLPIGTVIPFDPNDLDAGPNGGPQRCKPPVITP